MGEILTASSSRSCGWYLGTSRISTSSKRWSCPLTWTGSCNVSVCGASSELVAVLRCQLQVPGVSSSTTLLAWAGTVERGLVLSYGLTLVIRIRWCTLINGLFHSLDIPVQRGSGDLECPAYLRNIRRSPAAQSFSVPAAYNAVLHCLVQHPG
jgi:hypothetical protein